MTTSPAQAGSSTDHFGPQHHPNPAKPSLPPGSGVLHLTSPTTTSRSTFSTLLASYPLKLLSPSPLPSQPPSLASIYTLAYGGGLVAGDTISLRLTLERGAGLVCLTQGSTKVYKRRAGVRPLSHRPTAPSASAEQDGPTRQRLHATLGPDTLLLLLPDSISPFASSRYAQAQRFLLPGDGSASLLLLDWVNSGRGGGRSEIWSMDSYASTNEVFLGEQRLVMRERTVLDNSTEDAMSGLSVERRLAPYHVYATVLLVGPRLKGMVEELERMSDRIRQFQVNKPAGLIWAWSPVEAAKGGVLRLAGEEVEDVRKWLRGVMDRGGIKELVGEGLWGRVI